MQSFVKRPEEVEAVKFTGGEENSIAIVEWVADNGGNAAWYDAVPPTESENEPDPGQPEMLGLAVYGQAHVGNWIVKLSNGTFTIMSEEEFTSTYQSI